MTNIQLLSDLHLEFHRGAHLDWLDLNISGEHTENTTVILAGDIFVARQEQVVDETLQWFCERYKHVVFIEGNHEFYGAKNARGTLNFFKGFEKSYANLHVLHNEVVTLDGQKYYGGTLWFPYSLAAHTNRISDHNLIPNYLEFAFEQHELFKVGLGVVDSDTVVISHHLPSFECVSQEWRGSPMNALFVGDCTRFIEEVQPKLWVSGHTHDSFDFKIGETRMLCNPYGYNGQDTNGSFDCNLIVGV